MFLPPIAQLQEQSLLPRPWPRAHLVLGPLSPQGPGSSPHLDRRAHPERPLPSICRDRCLLGDLAAPPFQAHQAPPCLSCRAEQEECGQVMRQGRDTASGCRPGACSQEKLSVLGCFTWSSLFWISVAEQQVSARLSSQGRSLISHALGPILSYTSVCLLLLLPGDSRLLVRTAGCEHGPLAWVFVGQAHRSPRTDVTHRPEQHRHLLLPSARGDGGERFQRWLFIPAYSMDPPAAGLRP